MEVGTYMTNSDAPSRGYLGSHVLGIHAHDTLSQDGLPLR